MKYPKMTRCHFQFIADIIAEIGNREVDICGSKFIAEAFANELYGTNNNFDRGRFMEACKPPKEDK